MNRFVRRIRKGVQRRSTTQLVGVNLSMLLRNPHVSCSLNSLKGGYIGDCQNYGPFLGPYYNTGPNTGPNLGDPKRDHNFDNAPYRGLYRRFISGLLSGILGA